MKRILALALSLMMLLCCVSALAETAEQDTVTMIGSFSIKYPKLPGYYSMTMQENSDMSYRALFYPEETGKPHILLVMEFSDEWDGVNTLADASEEDMAVLKADFYEVTELDPGEIIFADGQTKAGVPFLIAKGADGSFGAVYTIYMSHEVEVDVFPGGGTESLTDANMDTVIEFISNVEFTPIEKK